jgi:Zn-dependent peptidase ImmA (M78 family)/DNA-binding XRE family transcriptional regulator
MNESVNPSMVTLAREARGLTQTELADILEISQAQLSKIEAGLSAVSGVVLALLAKHLKFPETFFYQSDQLYGLGASEYFHRKRQSVPAKVLLQLHARINIQRIHLTRLLRGVELPNIEIPQFDIEDFGDAAEVARAVRATLQVPAGPIQNLTQLVEDAGGVVFSYDFGTPQVDGVSRLIPGLPPMFFLNSAMPADRTRLSLAHELGHLVMHRAPNPDMEAQANAFAAEFLMPEAEIRHQLHQINLDRCGALKPVWRVSMAALLFRAQELECITPRAARFLWMRMGKLGYRRREPIAFDLSPEPPKILSEMMEFYQQDLGYSVANVAHMLNGLEREVATMYGLEIEPHQARQQIRRVK